MPIDIEHEKRRLVVWIVAANLALLVHFLVVELTDSEGIWSILDLAALLVLLSYPAVVLARVVWWAILRAGSR